ncbi:efflux RND transporter periplasmic adaptor subunit [Candidatus Aerophobetes bacterium]|nr:efflux RND transporter periplasmic adaptor subunit [Candidatus Aerophobetes bacterium]
MLLKKKKVWIPLIILIAAAGTGGTLYYYTRADTKNTASMAQMREVPVWRGEIIDTTQADGVVGANRRFALRAKNSGEIARVYVSEGEMVDEKQLIAELDTEELKIRLRQAEIKFNSARQTLERVRYLFEQKAISKGELEDAEFSFAEAEENLNLAKLQFEQAFFKSPIRGVVTSLPVQETDMVSSGSDVAIISELDPIKVIAYINEIDIRLLKVGQKAIIVADAYPKREFQGKVIKIAPEAGVQDGVVSFEVTVELSNKEGMLKPGMSTEVQIITTQKTDVLLVPREAIRIEEGQTFVMVREGEKETLKKVRTGLISVNFTEIIEGLKDGDKVLVSAQTPLATPAVRPGAPGGIVPMMRVR